MILGSLTDRSIIRLDVGPAGSWTPELAALHVIAFVLLVACASAWGRHRGRRPIVVAGAVTVWAILVLYFKFIRHAGIPADWIAVLHHGLERKSILQLYTEGVHAGDAFHFVTQTMAAGAIPNLHDVVRMNLLFALISAAMFFFVAIEVTGLVWAIPWTLAFALNPGMSFAAFSELPTSLLAVYFLAGVIGWAVLTDPQPQPRALRTAGYILCAILTVLAALTRLEVALIGVVALGIYSAHFVIGEERWTAGTNRLAESGKRVLAFLADHGWIVAVLCLVGIVLQSSGIPNLISRTQTSALYPFDTSIFVLFAYLPMLLLPIGASLGVLFGAAYLTVHFRRYGGLALSLAILVHIYFSAWSEFFEMGRYISYVLPAIFFTGLLANRSMTWLPGRWSPNWVRAVRVLYLMSWFTVPLPGIPEYYARTEYHWDKGLSQLLLDRDTQREVRHLLRLTESNPQCAFVARVVEDQGHGDVKVDTRYDYIAFGGPIASPIAKPESEATLAEFIAAHAAGASCVRLYYGGDCNLTFADGCTGFVAGRRKIEEERFASRPYVEPLETGHSGPEIVLATYAWP